MCEKLDIELKQFWHTANLKGNEILLLGGINEPRQLRSLNVKNYDLKKIMTKGYSPHDRLAHGSEIIGNDLFIYAGYNREVRKYLNDLHKLNLENLTWNEI